MNNELTPAEIDAIIAEKVMGWKIISITEYNIPLAYIDENRKSISAEDYHPTSNITQAFEALDRTCQPTDEFDWNVAHDHKYPELFACDITNTQKGIEVGHIDKIRNMAICLAILDYRKAVSDGETIDAETE
jgi:hypothetical protein